MTDTTRDGRTIEVTDDPAESAFLARVDGTVVGRAVYTVAPGKVIFLHTEVDESMQGQGIASVLAREALDQVAAGGRKVVPRCPFIAAYIKGHPAYAELVS